jgi:transcriptional regulator with GAF, ATPase, and Fis domain
MRYLDLDVESPELRVMRLLVELCGQVVGAEEGSLLVVDHAQDPPRELIFAMTVGSRQSEETLSGQRVPLGEGLVGIAAVTHEVQIGAPLYDGIEQARRGEAPRGQPTAVIAAPMLIDDRLVGVITAVSFEAGKRFTNEHAALYARAASVAGVVVDQRRRIDALESRGVGGAESRRLSADEPLARQILEIASRLVERSPGRLRELARILSALEEILGDRGP